MLVLKELVVDTILSYMFYFSLKPRLIAVYINVANQDFPVLLWPASAVDGRRSMVPCAIWPKLFTDTEKLAGDFMGIFFINNTRRAVIHVPCD